MNAPVTIAPELLTQLTQIVGENRIKTDADSLENWGKDHTKHFEPQPSVIVSHRAQSKCKQLFNWPISLMLRLPLRVVVQVYRQVLLLPMVKLS